MDIRGGFNKSLKAIDSADLLCVKFLGILESSQSLRGKMFKFYLVLLNLIMGPAAFAGTGSCFEDCQQWVKKCEPIKLDIMSGQRFRKCGGKALALPHFTPDMAIDYPKCIESIDTMINEIHKVEKAWNYCKASDDCSVATGLAIPVFINKERMLEADEKLDKVRKKTFDKYCIERSAIGTLDVFINDDDNSYPNNFTCEENKCIPHFSGKKTYNWTNLSFELREKQLNERTKKTVKKVQK